MPRVLADVPYARGEDAVADIHLPDGPCTAGLMLNLHGGGWYTGDKSLATRCSAEFASRGFVVVNANYRIADVDPVPAMVIDAVAAARWTTSRSAPDVVRLASTVGGGGPSLIVTGDSAGAHIAMLSAQAMVSPGLAGAIGVDVADLPRMRAVVSWSGALSLRTLHVAQSDERATRFAGYLSAIAARDPGRLALLDPVNWIIPRTPPALAFTSAVDFFRESTVDYVEAATSAGIDVELVAFDSGHPGCVHSWQLDPTLAESQETYDLTTEFSRAHP